MNFILKTLLLIFSNHQMAFDSEPCNLNHWPAENIKILKNANILDPSTKERFWGHIVIQNRKIVDLLRCTELPTSSTASNTIDIKGKWVLPGLMDLHIHNWGDNIPPRGAYNEEFHDVVTQEEMGLRMLRAGQTSYLDLFAPNDMGDNPAQSMGTNIFDLRTKQQNKLIQHPNVYVSGPLFVVENGHSVSGFPDAITLRINDDYGNPITGPAMDELLSYTKSKVRNLIQKRKPDVIKLIFDSHKDSPITGHRVDMPLSVAKVIIEEATRNKTKTVAHVGSWESLGQLPELGLSAFTHLPNGPAPQTVIDKILSNQVSAITTIALYSDIGLMGIDSERAAFLKNVLLKLVAPVKLIASYWSPKLYDEKTQLFASWSAQVNEREGQKRALMSLYQNGVNIIAGSDGGNVGTIIGYTLHRELSHMKKFGMDPWDVLSSATSNPGEFLGNNRGKIQVGAIADLIVIDSNPLESISSLQTINSVFLSGEKQSLTYQP